MATVEAALRGLYSEVVSSIKAIDPTSTAIIDSSAAHFTHHNEDEAEKPITQMTGPCRLFAVGAFREVDPIRIGHSNDEKRYEVPVTFCYRRSARWSMAAMDDMAQVRHWFLNNQGGSGVSGIASRFFDPSVPPEVTENPVDPWDYHTIRLKITAEITFT